MNTFQNTLIASFLAAATGSAFATPLVNGLGGTSGFGENIFGANDDGSVSVDLTPAFGATGINFFGTNYTSLFLNNNGNVTFNAAQSAFTPFALTGATSNPIIAPYFADVDTRGGASTTSPGGTSTGTNLVHYDVDGTTNTFSATWDDVGFYNSNTAPTNAFQLQLIGQGGGDFDILFTYEDINWTAGSASGGDANGLGGTTARAGYNSGNGTDFFEISQSGNEAQMLALDTNPGQFLFQVRNGAVTPVPVPAPAGFALMIASVTGLIYSRRKVKVPSVS